MFTALLLSASLTAFAAGALATSTTPSGDINALPSGPKSAPTARDNQQDAEAAYEQARAECRRVTRDERRDCIKRAQRDYDKSLQMPVPRTAPRPATR